MKKPLLMLGIALAHYSSYAQNTFPSSGNVGVGTSTPNESLTIAKSGLSALGIYRDLDVNVVGSAGQNIDIGARNGNSFIAGAQLQGVLDNTITSGRLFLNTLSNGVMTTKLMVNSNGNIGIGTTSPSSLLDIVSSTNSSWATQIINNGSSDAHGLYVNIGSVSTGIPFRVDVNGSVKLQISNNGNVLIGKTSQTNNNYKLDVNGTARVNEVVVNTTGADFVFDDDYKFPKLSEVKDYIDKNHHLPQIPSAQEMQKNGMNVGELNTKLLQKIEELTLYLIEKDEQLSEQQKTNQSQQEQINQLKEQLTLVTKALIKN